MHFIFDKNKEYFLKLLVNCATSHNTRIFLVGGIVRDYFLNIPIKDIDLIVEGSAIELSKKFPPEIKIKSIHQDFSTVKVEFYNEIIDIASTRTENYPYSGCLPVVEKVGISLEQDFKRRDFSINAMYAEIKLIDNKLTYELIDLSNGQKDLKEKTLRVLHDKSYIDDPTRILRGIDFKYRFNFDFSEHDKKSIQICLNNLNLENASRDRILNVFIKILNSNNQDLIFKEIIEKKYYKILGQNNLQIDLDFINKIIKKFNLKEKYKANFYLNILQDKEVETPKALSKLNDCELAYHFYKTKDKNIEKYLKIKDVKLFLKGKDLIDSGFKQGKQIGIILDELLKEKIQNTKIKTKLDEINWVKSHFH